MKNVDVSVIVPVYKTEKYLKDCVESILSQNYTDYEIILVDDGSLDEAPSICDEYCRNYQNIKVVHKKNGGLSSARNIGIENAVGKYLIFVDSDDTVEPDLLESVVPVAERAGSDVVIFGINTIVSDSEGKIRRWQRSFKNQQVNGKENVKSRFLFLENNDMWNQVYDKLYRSSIIKESCVRFNSYYDKVCEDSVFLLDLFPYISSVSITCGVYYNYYIRKNQSIVTYFLPERYDKAYEKYKKIEAIATDLDMPIKSIRNFLYQIYCTHILWTFEFLFHDDYPYGINETYKYIKETFSIRNESKSFCKSALTFFNTNMSKDYSRSSGFALKAMLRNNYMIAWLCFLLTKIIITRIKIHN